ncbi:M20 family metallopeptidase [Gluconobacter kanchanaburiensis]|uniref:Carboxypeptidase n=1 Tax=Gluconobacter kanchanaburiensis NBRC 103587 TaxID=1307948 RepID=A0A511B9G3_9PROT|nr:M20 family metallopeptidase [Gluconobacter kanchanaburiensis]MBF0862684.1 M20 family metallopeptidase [Gluconobacter kanchanaburiensis]GBR67492.1 acetylornithine deacetylase [Gluconobacter kanchanaburiensis NBRC 103587]GEK96944.1 carboxypeptidase [Gluconobacter kanchanaburiensis NBRC 103587]
MKMSSEDLSSFLAELKDWVSIETPTTSPEKVNELGRLIMSRAEEAGLATEIHTGNTDTRGAALGDHIVLYDPQRRSNEKGILLLSHIDTVHPIGTLAYTLPWKEEGDRIYGPGIADMKAGVLLAFRALARLARTSPLPIRMLIVSDEEIGSPSSRRLIEEEAAKAKYVLVTEPGRPGNGIVSGRKGVGRYFLSCHGRPAHSGRAHAEGRSAIRELAHQILALEAMTDESRGITVNVGLITGGTGANVVAEHASAVVDLRVPDRKTGAEMNARILGLKSVDPDVAFTVEGDLNRPGYVKDQGISDLVLKAESISKAAGQTVFDLSSGGGSDGNFSAAMGVPTLDALGIVGDGAHTLQEYIEVSSIPVRWNLLTELILQG